MILKKPYAFLIKYFRIIHLLLVIPIIYLILKTGNIVNFFTGYVNAGYYTDIMNLSSTFINYFMYIAAIVVLLSGVAIYFLMRKKEKSTKFYFFLILFYVILLVMIGVVHSILSNMELNIVEATTARAFHDISYIFYLPQYVFAVYMIVRGIGFDIKKFNFELDLKELEITDVDNEEFEFNIGFEDYKLKRNFRRFIREFRYYVRENKFIFGILCSILVIVFGTIAYLNFNVYNKTYQQSEVMSHNNLNLKVTGSMLTNRDFSGNILKDNKHFLVLKVLIENKGKTTSKFDYNNFFIDLGDKRSYPSLDKAEYFIDYALLIKQETEILPGSSNTYVVAYEIGENDLKDVYTLKILEQIKVSSGDIAPDYKTVELKPYKALEIKNVETFKIGKIATFEESNIGYTSLQINNYYALDSFTYQYQLCYDSKNCREVSEKINSNSSNETLLVLEGISDLDKTTLYYRAAKSDQLLANHFFSIEYKIGNTSKIVNATNKTTKDYKKGFILQTSKEIKTADHINLLITIRDKRYIIELK